MQVESEHVTFSSSDKIKASIKIELKNVEVWKVVIAWLCMLAVIVRLFFLLFFFF